MTNLIGRKIGPYEIKDQIGQGGMATVYRAYQTSLNRYVAIKVLPMWMAQDGQFVQRFRQEALAAGGLRHPGILHIQDAGTFEGQHYIVMDYVPGGTLADRLRAGPLPPDVAADLAAQIAEALDYAHRRGIVHRDLKPTNVLMDEDGRPLLADFGIAQAIGSGPRLTQSGASVGTPEYMSPEQSQGERVDGRSDIYGLGIVLYQMLTGRVPFQSTTPVGTLYQVVHQAPTPPRQFNANIPPYLESIILRALAKRPEDRFANGREMAEALRARRPVTVPRGKPVAEAETRLIGVEAVAAGGVPAKDDRRETRRQRRSALPAVLGAVGVVVIALAAAIGFLVFGGNRQANETEKLTASLTATVEAGRSTVLPTVLATPTSPSPSATPVVIEKVVTATQPPTETSVPPTSTAMVVVVTVIMQPTVAPSATPLPPTATAPPPSPKPAAAVAPAATAKPGVILDFEDFGAWRRGDEPYGTLAQSNVRSHEGTYSAKLSYDIPQGDKDYVVFLRVPPAPIPGQPDALTMWVYGDGSNHYLNVWIQDNQGEVRQFTFGQVRHADSWQPMTARLDTTAKWPQGHISGPDNGQLDYPISLHALVFDIVPRSGVSNYSGAIFLDELTTGEVKGAAPAATPQGDQAAPLSAAPPGSANLTGRIVYTVASGGATDIVVVDVAAKNTWKLFSNARQPDMRGDGRVVFNGIGGGKNNLVTISLDGTGERITGMHPEDSYPHWSPSGVSTVFYSTLQGDGRERIYTQRDMTHAEEPSILKVNGRDVFGRDATWLETWRIAFTGCDYWAAGSRCGIWTVNSDGSGAPLQLTEHTEDRSTDSAGGVLLYASPTSGNWEVYAIPQTGGSARNLTNSPTQDAGATFSPDGNYIAFMSDRGDGWGIWIMSADGGNPQRLISVAGGFGVNWNEERLAWGP